MNISSEELCAHDAVSVTIIDVAKHVGSTEIRGAIRYRPDDLLRATHLTLPIATDRPLVLYDARGDDERLAELAAKFRANGYPDVRILTGVFAAYEALGGPTQEASTEQIIPPSKPQAARE